jgi:hypothetical protein
LGERLNGIQEVVGSIPISSTNTFMQYADSHSPFILQEEQDLPYSWAAENPLFPIFSLMKIFHLKTFPPG